MTDAPDETKQEENASFRARKLIVPIGIVLMALLVVAVWASQSGLDKALLKQKIDAFSQSLSESAAREGRDITLNYEDIKITGGFSNRHATIINPELHVKPLATANRPVTPHDELVLKTAEIQIFPKAVDLSAMDIRLSKPIDFFGGEAPEKRLLTVSGAKPFDIHVDQIEHDNRRYVEIIHDLPEEFDVTYLREQKAEGPEETTPTVVPVYEILVVTSTPGGRLRTEMAQDGSGLGSAESNIQNLVISPPDAADAAIKIAQISTSWEHTLNEKNHHIITAKAQVGDITGAPEVLPYAPIALKLDAAYEGVAPQSAADVALNTAQESSFRLQQFALTTKDSSLTASADFTASGGDVLPVGTAKITLTNLPFVLGELRRYGLLNANNEPLLTELLQLATGMPIASITDANIDITRARGGSFAIGHTTFEELFATVLKISMKQRLQKPVTGVAPAAPAAPVEKIQVEEGARG